MSERKESKALTIPEFTNHKGALDWLLKTFPSTEELARFVASIGPRDLIKLQSVVKDVATYCASSFEEEYWLNHAKDRFNKEYSSMQQCLQNRTEELQREWEAAPKIAKLSPDADSLIQLAIQRKFQELQDAIDGMEEEEREK